MKDIERFAWAIAVIIALGIGIFAGHSITAAYKDIEIMDLQAQVETANASLAEANVELAFWQNTMNGLAEGEQFAGVDIKYGRPNVED
jgi:NAD(P)H-dependent flavin oxidoreductase YrpB (nitropropane dioxygenase family)